MLDGIDIAIALATIFLSLSLLASGFVEVLSVVCRSRARWLRKGLNNLLVGNTKRNCEGLALTVLEQPLVKQLSRPSFFSFRRIDFMRPKGPAYIDARTFALAFSAVIKEETKSDTVSAAVLRLEASHKQLAVGLKTLLEGADTEAERLDRIGAWFEEGMDTIGEGYKRVRWTMLFGVGFVLASCLDISAPDLVGELKGNSACVQAIGEVANASVGSANSVGQLDQSVVYQKISEVPECAELLGDSPAQNLLTGLLFPSLEVTKGTDNVATNLDHETRSMPQPPMSMACVNQCNPDERWNSFLGCTCKPDEGHEETNSSEPGLWEKFNLWLEKAPGYLLTAFALSLGAPFWFDGLKTLLKLRTDFKPGAGKATQPQTGLASPSGKSAQSVAPVEPSAPLERFEQRLREEEIKDLQAVLGLRISQLSGRLDMATREEIRKWQIEARLPSDGLLSESVYRQIMSPKRGLP